MSWLRRYRIWVVGAVSLVSLTMAGCVTGNGDSNDAEQGLNFRNAAIAGNEAGIAGGGSLSDELGGGGPRNPGPGNGNAFPFVPGGTGTSSGGTSTGGTSTGGTSTGGTSTGGTSTGGTSTGGTSTGGTSGGPTASQAVFVSRHVPTGLLLRLDPTNYTFVSQDPSTGNLEDLTYVPQTDSVLAAAFNGPLLVKSLSGGLITIPYAAGGGTLGGYDADFDPTGGRIIASAFSNNRLEISSGGAPFAAGPTISEPGHIEVDTGRNRVYVAAGGVGNAQVVSFDRSTLTQVTSMSLFSATGVNGGLAYNVKSNRIYAGSDSLSSGSSDKVLAINPDDFNSLTPASVNVRTGVYAIVTDDDRDRVYAVSRRLTQGNGDLNVLNYTTLTPVAGSPLDAGPDPIFVAYDRAAARIVVLNSGGTLTVFNADTLTQIPGSPFTIPNAVPGQEFHSIVVVP